MRMLKLPDGTIRILIQGLSRARVDYFTHTEPYLEARLTRLEEPSPGPSELESKAVVRSIRQGLERVSTMGKQISPEVILITSSLEDPLRLADLAASNLGLDVADAQGVLETIEALPRLRRVHELLERELALAEMQQQISSQVRGEIDRSQREFFLRQQLRTIQQELGEVDDVEREMADYREKAVAIGLPEEAREAETTLATRPRPLTTIRPSGGHLPESRRWLDRLYAGGRVVREKKPGVFDHLRSVGPWMVSIDDEPLSVLDGMTQTATLVGGFAEGPVVRRYVEGGFGDTILSADDTSLGRNEAVDRYASLLRDLVPGLPFVSFVNSGAEANEKALALCRQRARSERQAKVLAFEGSFHGRTLLSPT